MNTNNTNDIKLHFNNKSGRRSEIGLKAVSYVSSFVGVLILAAIIVFLFSNGTNNLSLNLFFNKYEPDRFTVSMTSPAPAVGTFENMGNYDNFSSRFGVAFEDDTDHTLRSIVKLVYIDDNSPLKQLTLVNYNNGNLETVNLKVGFYFTSSLTYIDDDGATKHIFARNMAQAFANDFNDINTITTWSISYGGGGIRGSIVATLYLVIITLVIGFPIGILTALYLNELAPKNKFFTFVRSLIDMLTGVPSIIYGLLGASLLIPLSKVLLNSPNSIGGNMISGALTLSIIVLPVVIKTTESALEVVPKDYRLASLALGANPTQTAFKVVLPNALPCILSAALLTIGRVIGESAALIYAVGTVIRDNVNVGTNGTSLSVHIWSIMSLETPNVELAASIAIIILVLVLILNLLVKFITIRFQKKLGR